MKINKILFVFSFSLFLFSCVPAELDNIEAFVYTFPGLEEVEPLPAPVLTAPTITVVETDGDIDIPVEADQLVKDVIAAVVDENITQENLVLIESFSQVAPEITSEEIIETVTGNWITGILDGTIVASPEINEIADSFKDDPVFTSYLTQLDLPTVDGVIPGARIFFSGTPERKFFDNELLRILDPLPACQTEAKALYDKNIGLYNTQEGVQLAAAKVFYDNLRTIASNEYTSRIAEKKAIIDPTKNEIRKYITDFNTSVDGLDYPEEVIRGLKIYIIAFVIELNNQISNWEDTFDDSAEVSRDKKLAAITVNDNASVALIKSNFKVARDEQTAAYNEAADTCHNQGAGG
jgi:hypothetical protein